MTDIKSNQPGIKAKEAVLAFLDALNAEDFKVARKYVTGDFKFAGVLGSRDGADAYFKDMEKMKLKYIIKKTFVNDNDVCIIYDFKSAGITTLGCGIYLVENGYIKELKVIFDPRNILASQPEK